MISLEKWQHKIDLIIDANILFSALIKHSYCYKLFFNEKLNLITSEYIFTEFEEHKEEILEKTERTTEDFFRVLSILKRRVTLIPMEEIKEYIKEAKVITPDEDDLIYFALALKFNCAIWSNDKKMKNQNRIKIYHTHELEIID